MTGSTANPSIAGEWPGKNATQKIRVSKVNGELKRLEDVD
jgi:hypothetical protein